MTLAEIYKGYLRYFYYILVIIMNLGYHLTADQGAAAVVCWRTAGIEFSLGLWDLIRLQVTKEKLRRKKPLSWNNPNVHFIVHFPLLSDIKKKQTLL